MPSHSPLMVAAWLKRCTDSDSRSISDGCSLTSTSPPPPPPGASNSSASTPCPGTRCSISSHSRALPSTSVWACNGRGSSRSGTADSSRTRASRSPPSTDSGRNSSRSAGRPSSTAQLAEACTTRPSRSRSTSSAPCGWIDPARWISSRSQLVRSAWPKAGLWSTEPRLLQPAAAAAAAIPGLRWHNGWCQFSSGGASPSATRPCRIRRSDRLSGVMPSQSAAVGAWPRARSSALRIR